PELLVETPELWPGEGQRRERLRRGAAESKQGWSECVGLRVLAPGEVTGARERGGDTEPGCLADVEAAGKLGQRQTLGRPAGEEIEQADDPLRRWRSPFHQFSRARRS